MESPFFHFDPFAHEVARKCHASQIPPEDLFAEFLGQLEARVGIGDIQHIRSAGPILIAHFAVQGDLQYLSHPIRVAASLSQYLPCPDVDDIVLALVHNLFERTNGAGIPEINALTGASVLAVIRLLSIDRSQERDPRYLSEYYGELQKARRPIRVLKALDKLDNLLEWTSRPVDPFYFEVIRYYVCPLLAEDDSRLRDYLEKLESYVRDRSPQWQPKKKSS